MIMIEFTLKEIKLTQGKVAIVDECDYKYLKHFKWCVSRGYAMRGVRENGRNKSIKMHRVIMGVSDSKIEVDHINNNPLDNRRKNLRLCKHSENMGNQVIRKNNTTGFKGVHWYKSRRRWMAHITIEGKFKNLGYFKDITEAAKAYNKAAKKYFGKFANLNKIPC